MRGGGGGGDAAWGHRPAGRDKRGVEKSRWVRGERRYAGSGQDVTSARRGCCGGSEVPTGNEAKRRRNPGWDGSRRVLGGGLEAHEEEGVPGPGRKRRQMRGRQWCQCEAVNPP